MKFGLQDMIKSKGTASNTGGDKIEETYKGNKKKLKIHSQD